MNCLKRYRTDKPRFNINELSYEIDQVIQSIFKAGWANEQNPKIPLEKRIFEAAH